MEPQIRPLSREDLPAAHAVICESFQTVAADFGLTRENCPKHTSFLTLHDLQARFADGRLMFGLYAGTALAGCFTLSRRNDVTWELNHLAVLPHARHQGFGQKMLRFAKNLVIALGGRQIELSIIEESEILKSWYVENGFRHTGTKKYTHLPFTSGYLVWTAEKEEDSEWQKHSSSS
ncbi:MAG: GNAT family N-acetyltransferase [Ruminococcaceae bacterium]|nr:GNAT family N-acetyltransferase [Oscillospiraceae bacterium]